MNPLFSKISLTLLESMTFPKTVYAFDFDGILSKIEEAAAQASVTEFTMRLLTRLSEWACVAVVSGRSVQNIKQKTNGPGLYFIANDDVALLNLMKQTNSTHAVFLGDDETDGAVFSLSDPKIMTIRLGDVKQSNARFFVERQEDVNRLIEQIIKFYESHQRKV